MPKPQPDYRTYVYFPILPDSLEDPQEKYSAITNLIKTHIGSDKQSRKFRTSTLAGQNAYTNRYNKIILG